MPALDHRAARPHAPFIVSRSSKDEYSQMVLYRSRSPSPSRGDNELVLRGQAAKKGKNSAIAVALTSIQHTLERRSLDSKLRALGWDHPETMDFMAKIAASWFDQGLFEDTEALQRQIVDASRERQGEKHPVTLQAMYRVGITQLKRGRYDESEMLQVQVYKKQREALGIEHNDAIATLLELAHSWSLLGRFAEAELANRQAIKMREGTLGPAHTDTIEAIAGLARILSETGRNEEAEAALIQVLEAKKETLGPKDQSTIWIMGDLALARIRQGRWAEAEPMEREVLELKKEVYGPTHPATTYSMADLAVVWDTLGRHQEAESLMSETVKLRRKVLGETHPCTINSIGELARMQEQRQGREAHEAGETTELFHLSTDAPADGKTLSSLINEDEASDDERSDRDKSGALETKEPSFYESIKSRHPLPPLRRTAKAVLEKPDHCMKYPRNNRRRRSIRKRVSIQGLRRKSCLSASQSKVGGSGIRKSPWFAPSLAVIVTVLAHLLGYSLYVYWLLLKRVITMKALNGRLLEIKTGEP